LVHVDETGEEFAVDADACTQKTRDVSLVARTMMKINVPTKRPEAATSNLAFTMLVPLRLAHGLRMISKVARSAAPAAVAPTHAT
jgi:hypothetical protein|tara:strand:+ start:676 stop:930 length:255 start_codon:yes stop_codon:yes gene_type:complete